MTMTSLREISQGFDPALEFAAPPEWLQGRTVYGGLSAALALQSAVRTIQGDLPPLRMAMVSFVGPATGGLRFRTQLLRRGKSTTSIAVDGIVGDDICVRAEFLFAAARPSAVRHDFLPCPSVDGPESCVPLHAHNAPASLGNFELRPATTILPLSGATDPVLTAWARHGDASDVDPAVALIALADALPPAALATVRQMVPFSSMAWTLDFPQEVRSGNTWHLMRSTSLRAGDGYSYQSMEIWDEAGRLVLTGSQSVAIFG
jgi:acyl-CoA thioesterase